MSDISFRKAKAIWYENCDKKQNSAILLFAELPSGSFSFQVAASSLYRLKINQEVIQYGPARAANNYARIDCVQVDLEKSKNLIEFEIVYYNCDSFYTNSNPPFAAIEISDQSGMVIKYTDANNKHFYAIKHPYRSFSEFKHSGARHYIETYDFSQNLASALTLKNIEDDFTFLARKSPLPDLSQMYHAEFFSTKIYVELPLPEMPKNDFVKYYWHGRNEELQQFIFHGNHTGFLGFSITAEMDCTCRIVYDEIIIKEQIPSFRSWWANNIIELKLKGGETINFETFEVYTMQTFAVIAPAGAVKIKDGYLREYAFDKKLIKAPPFDNIVYQAAVETFRQNTLDVFMDCPDRERGGWLCDSFFMARANFFLTGNLGIEEDFIENFLIAEKFPDLPNGMLPMVYPSNTDIFIPQWPMWLILQIDEYRNKRHGKREFELEFAEKIKQFIAFFAPYINQYGLLENLPGWNFIEWSEANNYTHGVNIPTNFLFAKTLEIVSVWYNNCEYLEQAKRIKNFITSHAFDGEKFFDNLHDKTFSETGQYYALFLGSNLNREHELKLANSLFGRTHIACKQTPSAMFIGMLLRLELLAQYHYYSQLRDEISYDYAFMAEQTATLWEKTIVDSSCCHGFTAEIARLYAEAQR